MQVQVSNANIEGSVGLQDWVRSAVRERLARFEELLTRLDVHLSDENGGKAGADDKRCQMEARPRGLAPVSVTHKAPTLPLAVEGAANKMRTALSRVTGRLDNRIEPTSAIENPIRAEDSPAFTDSLRQDEFLDRQRDLEGRRL